jgi:hypothetical protein
MQAKIPETNKKPDLCYAITEDGLELPVIDVTHPAFAIRLSDKELEVLLQNHLKEAKSQEKMPTFLRRLMIRILQRQSFLMRGIAASEGSYLSGLNTYFLKLGADNLNDSYATELDRKLAATLPSLSVRLRLQDIAYLLADGLRRVLGTNEKAELHLLNIGGGPAIDSLNALIVLQKDHSGSLKERQVFIHTLDLDKTGPSFGARALKSLQEENRPLHGLDIEFNHVMYDWSEPKVLSKLVSSLDVEGVILAVSSEGALFEYGSDQEIVTNLRALHENTPVETIIAGTVSRADDIGRLLNSASQASLKLRGLEAFTALALRAGWKITKRIDRPLSHDILMEKT